MCALGGNQLTQVADHFADRGGGLREFVWVVGNHQLHPATEVLVVGCGHAELSGDYPHWQRLGKGLHQVGCTIPVGHLGE